MWFQLALQIDEQKVTVKANKFVQFIKACKIYLQVKIKGQLKINLKCDFISKNTKIITKATQKVPREQQLTIKIKKDKGQLGSKKNIVNKINKKDIIIYNLINKTQVSRASCF